MEKLNFVLQQMLRETAKPVEDLKVDRFLDQIKIQLQQAGNVDCNIIIVITTRERSVRVSVVMPIHALITFCWISVKLSTFHFTFQAKIN